MASGVSVDLAAIQGGIGCCKTSVQKLESASGSLLRSYRKAGTNGWRDNSYEALGAIVDECRKALEKPVSELRGCMKELEALARAVEEYEQISWNTTMNTEGERQLIREMEEAGAFNVSALELLRSEQSMSGNRLPGTISMTLPANTSRYSLENFAQQVLMQQDGLNNLTVYDFLTNYENRRDAGRDPESATVQREYRQALVESLMEDLMADDPEMTAEQARADAESCAGIFAALHNPDQIVGGSGFGVTAAGLRNVNSALGSLWRHGRAEELYDQVREASRGMSEEEMRNTYLNIRLDVVDRYG